MVICDIVCVLEDHVVLSANVVVIVWRENVMLLLMTMMVCEGVESMKTRVWGYPLALYTRKK